MGDTNVQVNTLVDEFIRFIKAGDDLDELIGDLTGPNRDTVWRELYEFTFDLDVHISGEDDIDAALQLLTERVCG